MSSQQFTQVSYGLTQSLINVFPSPIVSATQSPTGANLAQIGTLWINKSANTAYVLTSIVNNLANWQLLETGGGAGVFTTLTVNPGPTNLSTVGNGAVTIGNAANTAAITIASGIGGVLISGNGNPIEIGDDTSDNSIIIGSLVGSSSMQVRGGTSGVSLYTSNTGNIVLGQARMSGPIDIGVSALAGQVINIGAQGTNAVTIGNIGAGNSVTLNAGAAGGILLATAVTGTITLGDAAMTGAIALGASTAGQIINMGNVVNTGAQTINIGSGNSGANSSVNILNGVATAGAQTFNLMASGGQAGFVNIANGAAANSVIVGSTSGAAITTIQGGTLGIELRAPFTALPGPVYLYTGAGAPGNGLALHAGDFYINTTPTGANDRLFIATGAGAWTFIAANA